MIIRIHLIMLFLPSIVHIVNLYFGFINSPLIFNIKQQPRWNLLKKYRKRLYRKKIKTRNFCPTNNQLLEKTDKSTFLMTKGHPEINTYLLSYLRYYLALKKHWRKIVFDTGSFDICANYGASSCATPDEIDFIPGNYKFFTGVTINGIAEVVKAVGHTYCFWIFQDDKRESIELIIEQVLRIIGLTIRIIWPQLVAEQTGHIGDWFNADKDEDNLIIGGFKLTTKYNANSGLTIYTSVNGI